MTGYVGPLGQRISGPRRYLFDLGPSIYLVQPLLYCVKMFMCFDIDRRECSYLTSILLYDLKLKII